MTKIKEKKAYKHPRAGEPGKYCEICGRNRGLIRRYGITLCRQCFKSKAKELGFEKYN